MEHLFDFLLQDNTNGSYDESPVEEYGFPEECKESREKLYISERLLAKISKYLEQKPQKLRCNEVFEDGWFNKKESYVHKRLKYRRNEGKYCLGISEIYRSYNGHRITRYRMYWLYDRDVYFINKGMPFEPGGDMVDTDTLPLKYEIINLDRQE